MQTKENEGSSLEEMVSAFEIFDERKTGFIDHQTIRHCMRHFEPKLTEVEFKELLKVADPENTGRINYSDFITKICV